jgi:hypothetical protein
MTGTFPSDDDATAGIVADSLSDFGKEALIHWQCGGAWPRNTDALGSGG